MSVTLLDLDASALDISLSEALRYMGMKGEDPKITAIAEELLATLRSTVALRACYTELPVTFEDTTVGIGEISSDSAALRKSLNGCEAAVLFAATIGSGADRLIARYSRLAPSKAVILGGLGSAVIERWCDHVCDKIAEKYSKIGKCVKPRFSPGYGGFELASQKQIARILDTERRIGLYFTESLMMIPEKSVTAVAGIYENKGN